MDEVVRTGRPETLNKPIELAIKIDNRLYERSLKKRGQYMQIGTCLNESVQLKSIFKPSNCILPLGLFLLYFL
jgi:hypothetical protein